MCLHLPEYCVEELFNPTCDDGKLLLMNSALYGRMKLGKCIPTNLGYLGCKADVLDVFDGKCSGENSCDVPVTNSAIQPQGGCIKGLESYLEVEYSCVEGILYIIYTIKGWLNKIRRVNCVNVIIKLFVGAI